MSHMLVRRRLIGPVLAAVLLGSAILFAGGGGWPFAVGQPQTLSLDSSAVSSSGDTLNTVNLAVRAGDVVVVDVNLSPESVAARSCPSDPTFPQCQVRAVVSSIASPGMTFRQRFAWLHKNPDATWMWRYWTVASSTGTASIAVGVNSSATWTVIGYSISGANTTDPFDAGLSSSYNYSPTVWNFNDCNQQDGCSVSYSTTGTGDMILAEIGSEGNPTATAPPGFTLINQVVGDGYLAGAAAYAIAPAGQNHASTGSWSLNTGESALWTADAIVAAGASGSSTTPSTSSSSTTTTLTTNSTSSTTSSSTSTTSSSTSVSSTSTSTSSSSSSSTTTSETLVTSTCAVTFTLSDGNVTGWSGVC